MGFFSRLFGAKSPAKQAKHEHSVIVNFSYKGADLGPIFELEDRLVKAIEAARVGEFDGNEFSEDLSDCYFYMYGPDADQLFAVIQPILKTSEFMHGATTKLRYGPPNSNARETEVKI